MLEKKEVHLQVVGVTMMVVMVVAEVKVKPEMKPGVEAESEYEETVVNRFTGSPLCRNRVG